MRIRDIITSAFRWILFIVKHACLYGVKVPLRLQGFGESLQHTSVLPIPNKEFNVQGNGVYTQGLYIQKLSILY